MDKENNKQIEKIFTYQNQTLDLKILESKNIDSINSKIYFLGIELKGGIESSKENEECFFYGEYNEVYCLQESNLDSKKATQTLQVFLDSKVLTILHYSILESSLNIKLESKSKEAKKILSKELDCHDFLQKSRNDKLDSIESSLSPTHRPFKWELDSIESIAMLCPILEDNEIKCIHGGIVKLQSNKGKPFKSNNKSMILESDLLNSQIIGCQNTILGVPTPCTLVSLIIYNYDII